MRRKDSRETSTFVCVREREKKKEWGGGGGGGGGGVGGGWGGGVLGPKALRPMLALHGLAHTVLGRGGVCMVLDLVMEWVILLY